MGIGKVVLHMRHFNTNAYLANTLYIMCNVVYVLLMSRVMYLRS